MYYNEKPGPLDQALGCAFFASFMLLMLILAARLVLGLVPHGFW